MDGFTPSNIPVGKDYLLEQPNLRSGGLPQLGADSETTLRALVNAIRTRESGGDPAAVSPQGAHGAMQVMPATFKQYAGPGETYENEQHREAVALRKLADDFQFYGGNLAKTAAAYIGGRGAVLPDGTIRDDVRDALGTTPRAYAEQVLSRMGVQPNAAQTPPEPPKPPPTWDVVLKMPEMQGMPSDQIEAARNQYFLDVVAPVVSTEQLQAARKAFDDDTMPTVFKRSVDALSETVKAVRKGILGGSVMEDQGGREARISPRKTITPLQWLNPEQFEDVRHTYDAISQAERERIVAGIDPAQATIHQHAFLDLHQRNQDRLKQVQGGLAPSVALKPNELPLALSEGLDPKRTSLTDVLANRRATREQDQAEFEQTGQERAERYQARGISQDVAALMAAADNADRVDRSRGVPRDPGLMADLANTVADLPTHVKAALAQYFKGSEQSDQPWIRKAIRDAEKLQAERAEIPGGDRPGFPGIGTRKDIREFPQNLAFSAVSMLAGIGGAIAGGLVAGLPGVVAGGAAASGHAAYRMATSQFADELRQAADKEALARTGRKLTDQEWQEKQGAFRELIVEHGLWEALPELASNAIGLKLILAPMKRIFGNSVATRFGTKLATMYGVETATEATTQMGQHNVGVRAGLSTEAPRNFASFEDWKKSVEEVWPQVFLLTTVMGGVVGAAGYVKGRYDDTRDITMLKSAGQEASGFNVIPDKALPRIIERADELSAQHKDDADLAAAVAALHTEQERRASQPTQSTSGRPATGAPGMPSAEGVLGGEPGESAPATALAHDAAPAQPADQPAPEPMPVQRLADLDAQLGKLARTWNAGHPENASQKAKVAAASAGVEIDRLQSERERLIDQHFGGDKAAAFDAVEQLRKPPAQAKAGNAEDLLADAKDIFKRAIGRPAIWDTIQKAAADLPEVKRAPKETQDNLAAAIKSLEADPAEIFALAVKKPDIYRTIAAAADAVEKVAQKTAPKTAVDQAAHQAATSPQNPLPEPTQAQEAAGNHTMGHPRIAGLDLSIQYPEGSTRFKDTDHPTVMRSHYGYIRGTKGRDKEHIDAYLVPGTPENFKGDVYVIDQRNPKTGAFDEHKAVIGARSAVGAQRVYDAGFSDGSGPSRRGATTKLTMDGFKTWLTVGDTTRPIAYKETGNAKGVRNNAGQVQGTGDARPSGEDQGGSNLQQQAQAGAAPGDAVRRGEPGEAGDRVVPKLWGVPVTDEEKFPLSRLRKLAKNGNKRVMAVSQAEIARRDELERQRKIASELDKSRSAPSKQLIGKLIEWGGVNKSEALDIAGDRGVSGLGGAARIFRTPRRSGDAGNHIVEGHGLDDIAVRLVEVGMLPRAELDSVDGGVQLVRDMIRDAIEGRLQPTTERGIERRGETEMAARAEAQAAVEAEGLPATPENIAEVDELAAALQSLTREEISQLDERHGSLPDGEFKAAVIGFARDKNADQRPDAQGVRGGEEARGEAPRQQEAVPAQTPAEVAPLALTGESEQEIRAREEREAESARQAKSEQDRLAREEREHQERETIRQRSEGAAAEFDLTGTEAVDRATQRRMDQQAAEANLTGQRDLLSANPLNAAAAALRNAADAIEQAAKPAEQVEQNALTAIGFKLIPPNTWALTVPTENGSALFNVRSGTDTYRLTVARRFEGGVTGAPSREIGVFDSIEKAADAASSEIAALKPAEQPVAKERWQMTRGEFNAAVRVQRSGPDMRVYFGNESNLVPATASRNKALEDTRRFIVERALRDGKPVPAEVLADYPDLKPAEQSAPVARGVGDVGEELWWNRRNAIGKGLKWEDVKDLNPTLKTLEVTKSKVWPRPDYEQLVEDGLQPLTAHLIKQVYDSISTAPQATGTPTDQQLEDYIGAVQRVRDALFEWARDNNAQKDMAEKMLAEMKKGYSWYVERGLLNRIFPLAEGEEGRARYRNHPEHNRIALLLGGSKFTHALSIDVTSVNRAIKAITKDGWPAPQEAWQKQYEIKEDKAGDVVYRNGRRVTIDRSEFFVVTKAGRFRRIMGDGFTNREDAIAKAKELAERDRRGGDEEGPLSELRREGVERRAPGEDVTSQKLQDTFGFRGVNYGNWVNDTERQAFTNQAYDALLDLAEIMNLPPKALSLNGLLGLAFGAQGRGGMAAAHFVPGVNEINLTKTKGAGSLAHEWWHAVDHYFAVQAGERYARSDEPFLTHKVEAGKLQSDTIRPEIVEAFREIVKAMKGRAETTEETAARVATQNEADTKRLNRWLMHFREQLFSRVEKDKPRVLADFDQLAERVKRGDLGDGVVQLGGGKRYYAQAIPQAVSEIRNLYKDAMGHVPSIDDVKQLAWAAEAVKFQQDAEHQARRHQPQVKASAFLQAAKKKDEEKGGKAYWATETELGARAFQSYVLDKLRDRAARNDYLTRPQPTTGLFAAATAKRYPQGEERSAINAAFDKLVTEIKTRETDKGAAMFSLPLDRHRMSSGEHAFINDELALGYPRRHRGNLVDYFVFPRAAYDAGQASRTRVPRTAAVGAVQLSVDLDGNITSLHSIEFKMAAQRQGWGEKVLRGILATIPQNRDLFIENILPEAREFWSKMGVRFEPGRFNDDGYLSRSAYERARTSISDGEGSAGLVFTRRGGNADRDDAGGRSAGRPGSGGRDGGLQQEASEDPGVRPGTDSTQAPLREWLSASTIESARAEVVTEVGEKKARKIHFVQDWKDLPAPQKRYVLSQGASDAQAIYDTLTGDVYVVAGNIPRGRVFSVVMHDVGVHRWLKQFIGPENFERLVSQIKTWSRMGGDAEHVQLARAAKARIPSNTKAMWRDEELVAYFVEEAVNAGHGDPKPQGRGPIQEWFARLWEAVKAAIQKLGGDPSKLTVDDVVALARGALERTLTNGKAGLASSYGGAAFSRPLTPQDAEQAKRRTYSQIANAVIDRIDRAIDPVAGLPDRNAYLKMRYEAQGIISNVDKIGRSIYNTFRKASPEDAKAAYEYITTRDASPGTIKDVVIRSRAVSTKVMIDTVGQALVRRGLLSEESYEAHRGAYLPRLYLKHMLSESDWARISGGKKPSDMGYLKQRKDIPKEVRELLLGEIKDPGYLSAVGYTRAMRDMALLDWLAKISAREAWVLPDSLVEWSGQKVTPFWLKQEATRVRRQAEFYEPDQAKRARAIADKMDKAAADAVEGLKFDEKEFKQMPDTARYGRLRGLVVRREIFDDIVGIGASVPADAGWAEKLFGYGGWGTKGTQLWKAMKVSMNPPSQVRNFVSNGVLLHLSGVAMPMVPVRVAQAARAIVKNQEAWQIAKKYGVQASTFSAQELLRIERELLDLKARGAGLLSLAHMANVAGRILNFAGDAYQAMESLFKTAKIIDEMARKGYEKAGPEEQKRIAEDAVIEANKWLFDYSMVAPSVRYLRNAPVGAPFLTFMVKVAPRLIEVALKHPQRYLPYVMLWYGLPMAVASMLGVSDDDLDKLKKLLPESWQNKGNVYVMPFKDAAGRWQMVDLSYFLPWGQYDQAARQLFKGDAVGTVKSLGIFGGPLPDILAAWKTNEDPFTNRDIVPKGAPLSLQLGAAATYVMNMALPPWLTSHGLVGIDLGDPSGIFAGKLFQAIEGKTNKYGDPVSTGAQAALSVVGVNLRAVDPQTDRARMSEQAMRGITDVKTELKYRLQDRALSERERERIEKTYADEAERRLEKLQQFQRDTELPAALQ